MASKLSWSGLAPCKMTWQWQAEWHIDSRLLSPKPRASLTHWWCCVTRRLLKACSLVCASHKLLEPRLPCLPCLPTTHPPALALLLLLLMGIQVVESLVAGRRRGRSLRPHKWARPPTACHCGCWRRWRCLGGHSLGVLPDALRCQAGWARCGGGRGGLRPAGRARLPIPCSIGCGEKIIAED